MDMDMNTTLEEIKQQQQTICEIINEYKQFKIKYTTLIAQLLEHSEEEEMLLGEFIKKYFGGAKSIQTQLDRIIK